MHLDYLSSKAPSAIRHINSFLEELKYILEMLRKNEFFMNNSSRVVKMCRRAKLQKWLERQVAAVPGDHSEATEVRVSAVKKVPPAYGYGTQ